MITIKYLKNVKTWCFDINLIIQCFKQYTWAYQRQVTFTLSKECLHSLIKRECCHIWRVTVKHWENCLHNFLGILCILSKYTYKCYYIIYVIYVIILIICIFCEKCTKHSPIWDCDRDSKVRRFMSRIQVHLTFIIQCVIYNLIMLCFEI